MKRRFSSHMTLIELTSALFFLMLAMATIMGLFTKAYGTSEEAARLSKAVLLAQSCAALIEGSDEPQTALAQNGYEMLEGVFAAAKKTENMTVLVALDEQQTEVGKLYSGNVSVEYEGEPIVMWPAARYIIRK